MTIFHIVRLTCSDTIHAGMVHKSHIMKYIEFRSVENQATLMKNIWYLVSLCSAL